MSCDLLDIADWFTANGLRDLGYHYMNVDDCVVVGRNATGHLIEDPAAFPYGAANTSAELRARGYSFGWYTDRGTYTCS
jgi:alpha-galactosidase